MTKQIKYDWKKCVCRKTHISGSHDFIENQIYRYKVNSYIKRTYIDHVRIDGSNKTTVVTSEDVQIESYSIYYEETFDKDGYVYYRCYTYLPNDFTKNFADVANLRETRINELFDETI